MSTTEANKALARRFYEEFWCKGNADAADELVADLLPEAILMFPLLFGAI